MAILARRYVYDHVSKMVRQKGGGWPKGATEKDKLLAMADALDTERGTAVTVPQFIKKMKARDPSIKKRKKRTKSAVGDGQPAAAAAPAASVPGGGKVVSL